MLKKYLLLLVVFMFCVGCSENKDKLVMVTEASFAPYEYYSDGEIVGVDVDIAKEIALELGKELVIKDVAFDSIINEVKSGKADIGVAGISYSEERAKSVDFSNNYVSSRQVILVRDDNSNIKGVNDISDKRIAVQLGSVADLYVTEEYGSNNIVRQKKYLAAIQDLKDGKVDCVVMDELPAREIIVENPSVRILSEAIFEDSYGIIVNKRNNELLEVVNRVIDRLKKEGKIDEFVLKHSKS